MQYHLAIKRNKLKKKHNLLPYTYRSILLFQTYFFFKAKHFKTLPLFAVSISSTFMFFLTHHNEDLIHSTSQEIPSVKIISVLHLAQTNDQFLGTIFLKTSGAFDINFSYFDFQDIIFSCSSSSLSFLSLHVRQSLVSAQKFVLSLSTLISFVILSLLLSWYKMLPVH